jgi:outer membrane protein assembly factor BamB
MRILSTSLLAMVIGVPAIWAAGKVISNLPSHKPSHAGPVSTLPEPVQMPGKARPYGGTPINVLNYHYDHNPTGWNQAETDLTPASVASSSFGLLKTLKVDGNVYAEPLLVSGYTMPDGSVHDVLIVATGHNSVYAYDAQTYALLWKVGLGTPQNARDVGCGDVLPIDGIASTPVILLNNGKAVIYVVAATEPSSMVFQTSLHALDLGTGSDILPAAVISPSATLSNGTALNFDPQHQYVKAALASANGAIYVGITSHCDRDKADISGWLLSYDAATLASTAQFHTIETRTPGLELASIWMSGFAPAMDANGNIFLATGNGAFGTSNNDWGESVLNLPPALTGVTDSFTPAAYKALNKEDGDFGSGGVMLLPPVAGQTAPPLAVAMGKDAVLYLLNQHNLGGISAGDAGALQSQRLAPTGSGSWGGPAFYNSPQAGPLVYVQTDSDYLRAFSVATGATPALTQVAQGTTTAGYGGSLPVVSSNGAMPGTGVVWLVRRTKPPTVEAYAADSLGAPIFSASAGKWSNPAGNSFLTPLVANGRLFVPAYKTVMVFGLTQ